MLWTGKTTLEVIKLSQERYVHPVQESDPQDLPVNAPEGDSSTKAATAVTSPVGSSCEWRDQLSTG